MKTKRIEAYRKMRQAVTLFSSALSDLVRQVAEESRTTKSEDRINLNLEVPEINLDSDEEDSTTPTPKRITPSIKVSVFKFSRRVNKALRVLGVSTVGDLLEITPKRLMRMKNFGTGSLNQIREALWIHDLSLKGDNYSPGD
jgi:DNA-directed RNA polymerase alpha subunit